MAIRAILTAVDLVVHETVSGHFNQRLQTENYP